MHSITDIRLRFYLIDGLNKAHMKRQSEDMCTLYNCFFVVCGMTLHATKHRDVLRLPHTCGGRRKRRITPLPAAKG